ncbi:MAG TPA: CocE/NonD family hydrolase, partial [Reyranellaceae bacterium]|nr:CocE/NonD family hydrolase [Reyranellaceae bacterium]
MTAGLRDIREIEHLLIPLPDGTQLAARLWLPVDAERNPVPAILEYLPYRKRDGTSERDSMTHPWLAARGYAGVRVDIRGSGESDGLLADEYSPIEQADALAVIDWLARQPWCDGSVGMMGISWGGFNALQVAALRPPGMRAVLSLSSTDDRYADDIHYMGGCHITENIGWASTMFGFNSRPPDPAIVGDRWHELWLARLEANRPWLLDWLRHQRRDDFWRHGSVCEDYAAIEAAVLLVGGWTDGYTNSISRLLEHLTCPRLGIIGPWGHAWPHAARPGPRIGLLQEALRFWDHWLLDRDTGIMAEPMLRAWLMHWVAPAPEYEERPGRWVAEATWPSPSITSLRLRTSTDGRLEPDPYTPENGTRRLAPIQITGITGGNWDPYGYQGELPIDQREDDGRAMTFDSEPLAEAFTLLGTPLVELEVAIDRSVGFVSGRLCDVAPDGRSTRVSYGLLNLPHDDSHAEVAPLQ